MSANTSIEWADDSVSFWWGCWKKADGCKECYAKTLADRYHGKLKLWQRNGPRLYQPNAHKTLRKLNRKAAREGRERIVFINSMSDFFEQHEGPVVDRNGVRLDMTLDDIRRDAFRTFDQCDHLKLLLLTKEPENVRRMWPLTDHVVFRDLDSGLIRTMQPDDPVRYAHRMFRSNVWIGTSLATHDDEPNIAHLLKIRDLTPVLFLSIEPLIGRVTTSTGLVRADGTNSLIDWIIAGGESGPHARPCNVEWLRWLRDQCAAGCIPFFLKQLGARAFDQLGRELILHDKKGGDESEWPPDLRGCREFPDRKAVTV